MKNYAAVIQAGGKGTRMRSLTNDIIPKPLLPINGKPMLLWQIEDLKRFGIKDFIIITGHLGDKIREFFSDGSRFGINISYIEEKEPLGSAGALYYLDENARGKDIILVFGDVMFELDWKRMISFHEEKGGQATLLAHPNSHPYDSDILVLDDSGAVKDIIAKSSERNFWYANCVNAGICILSENVLKSFTGPVKLDLEKDIISALIKSGEVYAYRTSEYVKDAGTPERFAEACREQSAGVWSSRCLKNKQKCIFLDRDGTICKYNGLIDDPEKFALEDCAAEALKLINRSGYLAVVVTNQPVVARGMCSIEDVNEIHRKMQTLLGEQGAYLDDIVFCPHHPDKGYPEENPLYKIPCSCRKPSVGMIAGTALKYNIDLDASWMIGDSTIDIQTGKNAGIKTALVETGQAGKDGKYNAVPDITAKDMLEAAKKILERN